MGIPKQIFALSCDISWGHKQMYDVLLSIAGKYYSEFNKFTTIHFWIKSVVVCDLELEIFLTFYNSRIIRIKVHVSRMGDACRLDLIKCTLIGGIYVVLD